jgi:hypothetical protein
MAVGHLSSVEVPSNAEGEESGRRRGEGERILF